MTLAAKLSFQFDRALQMRGQRLVDVRAVRALRASPTEFACRINAISPFEVCLRCLNWEFLLHCECPEFQQDGRCEHLWAAILTADREGALREALRGGPLTVREMPAQLVEESQPYRAVSQPSVQLPMWQEQLTAIERAIQDRQAQRVAPSSQSLHYWIDAVASRTSGHPILALYSRARKRNGEWSEYKEYRPSRSMLASLADELDREVLTALLGAQEFHAYYPPSQSSNSRFVLPMALAAEMLPRLALAGRLGLIVEYASMSNETIEWDERDPWRLKLRLWQDERDQWRIEGKLISAGDTLELEDAELLLEGGFVFTKTTISRLEDRGDFPWIRRLKQDQQILFPDRERDQVLRRLLNAPVVPELEIDGPLQYQERRPTPRFGLRIQRRKEAWNEEFFLAKRLLDYGYGWQEDPGEGRGFWIEDDRLFIVRDQALEQRSSEQLNEAGFRAFDQNGPAWRVTLKGLARAVYHLLELDWHVEAEGKIFRQPGALKVDVRSGIDWFEVHGAVDYAGMSMQLPQLLSALRKGENMVLLGDGTFGLLPEEWLRRFAPLVGLGTTEDDHLRFKQNQARLLDTLLAAQPEVSYDLPFAELRKKLANFEGVAAAEQPEGFVGELRGYQKEGVGWIEFLREFGFGGCLADDMGVGKTAQVLAAFEARRGRADGPFLVVAPKSLVFNWRREAERFTPRLQLLEYTGSDRDLSAIPSADLVLTTYGTLLRDAAQISQIEFDTVVLDEAQAIKNASTATAKAVRLLRGRHRLALSGTPVENHLGELWSLFEFLNPGMLGEARVLQMSGGLARNPSEEARALLGQALRPFILRRTKKQVASELPDKTEQTIFCELEPAQRKLYEELRQHYRASLLEKVRTDGLARTKMHVLEALLRLRQAACHPALLDRQHHDQPAAKFEILFDHLEELREEGHKTLIFSQFTSLLKLAKERLDKAGIPYEYLDGSTRDREQRVEHFQTDPACPVFLISLKAGGLGLNLTAASYVFLLDPWWNPAVEAQAIDRAHRIGQQNNVFAYRLIAKDTVEEKVLELQAAKRDLANSILGADHSVVKNLTREDLELLLS